MTASTRLVALDHLRGFIVALVVLHHSVLAYCIFGHIDRRHYLLSSAPVVDSQHWAGFDVLVMLNDSFFMPLMFLLSGLFVWGGLCRKGAWRYLRGRLLRLGVPFAVAVFTIVPLAYYPSWLQAGGAPGFLVFWATMVTSGPWPSGPPWFVGVLLAFDAASALVFVCLGRPQQGVGSRIALTPLRCFGAFLICLVLAYLPFLALFGPSRWISFGPLAIQASRIGLYAACFAAGVVIGPGALASDVAGFRDALALRWPGWTVLAALTGAVLVGTQVARIRLGVVLPGWIWLGVYGITLATFCAAACFAVPAVFMRFGNRPGMLWDGLAAHSYAIYLLHYPVVTWMQYLLLPASEGAIAKAGTTFAAALALSWIAATALRRMPGLTRVI